jgi:hypothetical protein
MEPPKLSAINPVQDIVAIAATPSGDGIPRLANSGAFALATIKVGSGAGISASADTGLGPDQRAGRAVSSREGEAGYRIFCATSRFQSIS